MRKSRKERLEFIKDSIVTLILYCYDEEVEEVVDALESLLKRLREGRQLTKKEV